MDAFIDEILGWDWSDTLPAKTVKLVSWNISKQKGILQYIAPESPDIVCLQECTTDTRYEMLPMYVLCAEQRSHCGRTEIYVRQGIDWSPIEVLTDTCSIAALGVTVIGVHLAPSKEGKEDRMHFAEKADQLTQMLDGRIVILGDTNMRRDETISLYQDAWIAAGCTKDTKWTMDGHENSKWWPEDKYKWTCRYDRLYSHPVMKVHDFRLLKGQSDQGCLSDHYGIVVVLEC